MLKGNRLLCLTLLPIFITPSTIKPFHNQAWQHIENKVDNNEMVQDIRLKKLQEQFEKDRIELEKKKTDEEAKRQKEEPKISEPQWQEFELTFYSSLNCENGFGAITSTGSKLFDGVVASNHYKINTRIKLQGWGEVTVLDRGSNKYFNNDYRLDVYIPREHGESDSHYFNRVNKMGRVKVKGYIVK
jgi:3D (Asp-Asp-Asp) domain-containing protein